MAQPKPMKELTRIREERGLSQQGLADASGVNKATINQIERGRRSPNVETLEKLAAALSVEVADFFPKAQSPLSLEWLSDEEIPTVRREDLSETERAELDRVLSGEKPRAYFVPLEEGEEEETVTLRIYYLRLLEGDEPILQAMREATPEEEAKIRKQLEKAGR